MSFAFIGSFVTFMLLQPLIDFFAKTFDSGSVTQTAQATESSVSTSPVGWVMGVGAIGILCVILFLLCFRWTKERVTQIETEKNVSVKQDLKDLLHNVPWWILVATGLAALLFNAIRDSVAIYFFRDFVKVNYRMPGTNWDMTTIYFLVGQAANLIGVMAAPSISAKYGKKKTYMLAILFAGILSTGFYFIPNNIVWILIFQFAISVFAGYVLPLLWSMFADIVDHQELQTGRRATGLIFSSSSMSQKLGWAFGAALSGWILALFKYAPDAVEQTQQTLFGEHIMISLIPAVCCLIAFFGMMFYPLTDKKVKEIAEELNVRRQHAK
jgi:GPH family glycoside/pentoside/hexuronide:cation symporter